MNGRWTRRLFVAILLSAGLLALPAAASTRRAVIVGIDEYDLREKTAEPPAGRGWSNLRGSVNDAVAIRDMLTGRFGFDREAIRLLVNQEATRQAILDALRDHLVGPAGKDDELVLYFAGHGSQVRNSKSAEADRLDESIVPADSALGAPDIRDKELRPLLGAMLDRGARVTVILDSCHSGSGARGPLRSARPRALAADRRDVADTTDYGTPPEDRGALILSAARDVELAWETVGRDGEHHGAFTLALLHVLRTAGVGETAEEVYVRTRARLRAEVTAQEPVLAGRRDRRMSPFFGGRRDHSDDRPPQRNRLRGEERTAVAVAEVRDDGTLKLQGGWVNGLHPGSELFHPETGRRLRVLSLDGLAGSEAELLEDGEGNPEVGDLVVLDTWVVPAESTLRVWIPRSHNGTADLRRLARTLLPRLAAAGVRWVEDPVASTPSHVLAGAEEGWQLRSAENSVDLGAAPTAEAVLKALDAEAASLFLHLPASASFADSLSLGARSENDAIELVSDPAAADYVLVGRWGDGGGLEYAWVRPQVDAGGSSRSPLPARSDWFTGQPEDGLRGQLVQSALRLGEIRAWLTLESPGRGLFPYRLALRRPGPGNPLRREGVLREGEVYGLVLEADPAASSRIFERRYVYVFLIDSFGNRSLFFPATTRGNVENRFPAESAATVTPRIVLDRPALFQVGPPFGNDTYVLVTSAEPIPRPGLLETQGVRHRGECDGCNPLERLLFEHGTGRRGASLTVPTSWSIERLYFESVAEGGDH